MKTAVSLASDYSLFFQYMMEYFFLGFYVGRDGR